jgi:hypothetical protein
LLEGWLKVRGKGSRGKAWQLTEWAEEFIGLVWGNGTGERPRPVDVTQDWKRKMINYNLFQN